MSRKKKKVVFLSAEEKRVACAELLDDYLNGYNALTQKLALPEHAIRLIMAPDEREALLNRIVREPSRESIVAMTSALLTTQQALWSNLLTPPEQLMCHEWHNEGRIAELTVHFHCFTPPDRAGWPEYYREFGEYLLKTNVNMRHLKTALESASLPIEVGYTLYQDEIIRTHIVMEPIALDERGLPMIRGS